MTIDYRTGDTRDLIAQLPDGSVDLVATSPPFLALRSYLPADHHAKHAEIGSEPDPATFIDTLLGLTAEWGRVLAPHGSIAIELGDTYTGAGGYGNPDSLNPAYGGPKSEGHYEGRTLKRFKKADDGWPRAKSLALIPQLYAIALAYGRNPLTGRESPAGQWLVRNVIVWHRPNPAVGALGDKVRPSTSYIVVATRSPRRWFDLTAVRNVESNTERKVTGWAMVNGKPVHGTERSLNPAGAPPLDAWFDHDDHNLWTITTQPSRLAHYAMWPARLAERLVLSMCPADVCATCGEPRRRIEQVSHVANRSTNGPQSIDRRHLDGGSPGFAARAERTSSTIGWSDCGHGSYRPGVTLDPFAGTGTTPIVASLHDRTGIGFDLDPRNADLVPAREAEVRRNLFGAKPELPGQIDLFGSAS